MTAETAQARFDEKYITSTEIAQLMKVSRVAIHHARINGHLPDGVRVNNGQLYVWERVHIEPILAKLASVKRNGCVPPGMLA